MCRIRPLFKNISVLLICLFLVSCGGSGGTEQATPSGNKEVSNNETGEKYIKPEFKDVVFDKENAVSDGEVYIDNTHVSEGYVAVSAVSDARLKFQVIKEDTYNYDLDNDGSVNVFPLQSGDGLYSFRVMENVTENRYAEVLAADSEVVLDDEFQPYLRQNVYVNYQQDSDCVKLADQFSNESANEIEVVEKVYDYVCENIIYDNDKASSVDTGYIPYPDETLSSGKGICFDYASLTAAMLRSQGIPTKVIFGYVSPNNLYHAWNMFYTKAQGWTTVEFKVNEKDWTRIDLTFSANGADSTFIGDGSNYTDVYVY